MSRALLGLALLALVYALTLASADPLDLLAGLALGAVGVAVQRRLRGVEPADEGADRAAALPARVLAFPLFVGGLLADVARGTIDVALRTLHLRMVERPGIVLVPIEERTRLGVAVSALATTLSPGSLLVDVDWQRRAMLIHVIDASDPDAVRAQHRRFYERYQRRVFP